MKQMKSYVCAALFFLVPSLALAGQTVRMEGSIQGGGHVVNHTIQVQGPSDPNVALERDFVFQTQDGDYVFMPNLSRSVKVEFLNTHLVAEGVAHGKNLRVSRLYVRDAGKLKTVYDWDKEVKQLSDH